MKKKRIMLVDDEPDVTTALGMILHDEGFEVHTFNDSLLALSKFNASQSYDLVLLDVKMPKMDGFQLYEEIRKIHDSVRVCFITAYEVDYNVLKERFPKLATDYPFIKKPIGSEDFVRRVMEITNA
jgi:DNA-binding response OmpR family regulator